MKKISRLLVVASVASLAALTGAADCLGNGSAVVECASAADCAEETENTACDTSSDPGICVAPDCDEDADCQIADTGNGTYAVPSSGTCEDEGAVTVVTFDGTEVCGVAEDAEAGVVCADLTDNDGNSLNLSTATAEKASGGTVTICVETDTNCVENVCGAAE
jgi:hypothetical protein